MPTRSRTPTRDPLAHQREPPDWNFGTLAQRSASQNWTTIFDRIEQLLVGRSLLVVLIVVALWWGRRQRFWLGIVLVVVLAPLTFFNLYVVHDYYLAAISPALAAMVGFAAAWVWSLPRRAVGGRSWRACSSSGGWPGRSGPRPDTWTPSTTGSTTPTWPWPARSPASPRPAHRSSSSAPTGIRRSPYYSGRPTFMLTNHIATAGDHRSTAARGLPLLGVDGLHRRSGADPVEMAVGGSARPRTCTSSGTTAPTSPTRPCTRRPPSVPRRAERHDGARVRRARSRAPRRSARRPSRSCRAGSDDRCGSARGDLAWLPPVGVIYARGAGELRCHGAASIDVVITPN